jgi:hypothetical protein
VHPADLRVQLAVIAGTAHQIPCAAGPQPSMRPETPSCALSAAQQHGSMQTRFLKPLCNILEDPPAMPAPEAATPCRRMNTSTSLCCKRTVLTSSVRLMCQSARNAASSSLSQASLCWASGSAALLRSRRDCTRASAQRLGDLCVWQHAHCRPASAREHHDIKVSLTGPRCPGARICRLPVLS